ncbi:MULTISPECIES: SDR family oxidoreductase [unclassified Dietzia]|uniref:SDR family oxidoreductase n=2 Tax=Dietzia TaxID=37914 RepID=UPI0012E81797|nr:MULTISPECIES: SDR family oxidoreductase [unclassified Dietzia]QGW23123.1 putative oxidoreductase [Dietzia sp. DQ12-45-1b]
MRYSPTLLLAATAAGLAFLLAELVFGPQNAVFAPIAAVVATGLSAGQRRVRALEISTGVLLGIVAAELLARWFGVGAWQLTVAVLAATTAAVAFRASGLLSNQAAVAAVVVMVLVPVLETGPWVRLGDAVIGGAVAVVLTSVIPHHPRHRVTAVAARHLDRFASVLIALRDDLASGSLSGAERRLEEMDTLAAARQELLDAASATRERLPAGPGRARAERRRALRASGRLGDRVVLLVTSGRALCRAGANLVRHGDPVDPAVVDALDHLVSAVEELRRWTTGSGDAELVRRLALGSAVSASATYAAPSSPAVSVAVGQIRSAVIDLLRITGMSQPEAVAALEAAAGRATRPPKGPGVTDHADARAGGGYESVTYVGSMSPTSDITRRAEEMTNESGGFPAQEQRPPGLSSEMTPVPDHGEHTYRGSDKLRGMKALITGGDSGIGRAAAIAYAREGADVAISYLPEEESDAQDTRGWIEDAGRRAVLLPCDLRDETQCRQMVRDAAQQLGGLDILVNNAGYQHARGEGLETMDSENMDRVFKTNLYATIWASQEALDHLGPGSSIITTTSIQAYQPAPPLLDYAATKSALNNLTVNLASELGSRGIRVNAVAPGPIWTPLQPATQPGEKLEQFGSDTPLGRAGQPAECAGAFVFLASPSDAGYVSGTVLGVTGGKPVF